MVYGWVLFGALKQNTQEVTAANDAQGRVLGAREQGVLVYEVMAVLYYVQGASLRGRPTPPAMLALEEKVHRITRRGTEGR